MSEENNGTPRVVIDTSDGQINSVRANQEVDVIEVDYTSDAFETAVRYSEEPDSLALIPTDLSEPEDTNGGFFAEHSATVEPEEVNDIFEFASGDDGRLQKYREQVLEAWTGDGDDSEKEEDE